MTAAEHMAQVLRGTGLYTLDGDTQVDAELSAYGAGFALIEASFLELLGELFIETAAGYGLDCWELLFRPQVSAGTAGQRRVSLLARLGVGGDAHTLAEYSALLPRGRGGGHPGRDRGGRPAGDRQPGRRHRRGGRAGAGPAAPRPPGLGAAAGGDRITAGKTGRDAKEDFASRPFLCYNGGIFFVGGEIPLFENETRPEQALLVALDTGEYDAQASLDELAELTRTAGAAPAFFLTQKRPAPDTATCLGSGMAEEAADLVKREELDLAIFDRELSPTQIRNLEELFGVRVIDRTTLILDIFAQRARAGGQAPGRAGPAAVPAAAPVRPGDGLSRLGGGGAGGVGARAARARPSWRLTAATSGGASAG